ncbi:hypothetical protein EJ05DRAFT_400368 [Pseudovirgaria hyperparasitica]|uniref:Copper-fist domain-containing protein n=1 Tax=Pseudovirgaria hyperparasitica TaxID=470096 RepID=A0A6A6W9J1_9PEZI|nr:uncharacterized protein EJ05DRAFT_400368 [Pseudovirgaria hyperparasitica]KAF2757761.1 hypothetical protein EJ05DRAFT_400368 [Pseudovirgaria hyperparasitica]
MPWIDLNGEKKKVACGPCIRGHRSSKCDHKDRVLLEVRKPGRPLSSCPHPPGSCSCERVLVNYTVPKKSDCNCSNGTTPVSASANTTGNASHRVQKPRQKRASTSVTPAAVARALKDQPVLTEDGLFNGESNPPSETASVTFSASERSNNASSPPSSSHSIDIDSQSDIKTETKGANDTSAPQKSCCTGSTAVTTTKEDTTTPNTASTTASCCRGAGNEIDAEPPQKSCCSGPKKPPPLTSNGAAQPVPHVINTIYPPYSPFHQHPNGIPTAPPPTHSPYMAYPPHGNGPVMNSSGYMPTMPYQTYFPYQMQFPPVHNNPTNGDGSIGHNCNCGDSCACLGCASHPRNDTTREYIRYYSQFLGPPGMARPPPYHIANHYMSSGPPNGHFPYHRPVPSNGNAVPQLIMPQYAPPDMHPGPAYSSQPPHTWQMNPSHSSVQTTPAAEFENFNFNQAPTPLKMNGRSTPDTEFRCSTTPTHQNMSRSNSCAEYVENDRSQEASPTAGANSPTLSPSSFFLQSLELPGCDDPTGTCQCGDGCECVGCLTHGGHDGVPLVPDTGGQNGLDFSLDGNYTLDDAFADAPS